MSNTTIKPTVGRIVHYHGEGNSPEESSSGPYAAMIVAVGEEPAEGTPPTVTLAVWFSGRGTHEKTGVPQSAEPAKHCWCWPPRG